MSKVAAIFDQEKLKWVNGHHIRLLDEDQAVRMIGEELARQRVVRDATGPFVRKAALLLQPRIGTLLESADGIREMMAYPIEELMASEIGQQHLEDGSLSETA